MKKIILHLVAGISLLACNIPAMAATINITAEFSPSQEHPENNTFTNTTELSGYCYHYPAQCSAVDTFSIDMGGITASLETAGFTADSEPHMGMYFKMPGAWRDVSVTNNVTGTTSTVRFRIFAFSASYHTHTNWSRQDHINAWGSDFVYAPSPCSYSGVAYYASTYYTFMWKWPTSDVACYKIAKKDLTGEPYSIDATSIGYQLETPDPMLMASGSYSGKLVFYVGPGGDIDFGDNMKPSDSELAINFTLSVNHELKLTASDQDISLQPCMSGKVCTEEEGAANWERWMVTRIPPEMTGRSAFNLSSSGAFTVYLQCEQQIGSDCALRSDNAPTQIVPVQTFLTLPDNIVDMSTSATVAKRRLTEGKDLTKNIFVTRQFGQNRSGAIDFLIAQKDVETMLQTRPDTFRGAVTIFFDPKLY